MNKFITWVKKLFTSQDGTIKKIGDRRYYIHENGQYERLED